MSVNKLVATPKKRLGEIFVDQGIISALTAERILQKSEQLKRRFGTILEELELVSGAELAAALASQHDCKVFDSFDKLKVSKETIELIPLEVAIQQMVFPLKRDGTRLAVAMADPTDLTVGDLLTDTSLQLIPYIATKEAIRAAICQHYMSKVALRAQERTIVLAEKDPGVLAKITAALSGQGYRIIPARDGMEAFKLVISQGPHVVIADLDLPIFNGNALLSALQNIPETKFIPVILLTEKQRDEDAELRAFERGFFDVLFKPLHPSSLQARVKRAFHFYDHQYRIF